MEDFLGFVADVGAPIAGAIFLGFFVFLVMKQMLEGLVGEIKTLTMFCQGLENRARTMSNEMVKIDLLVSAALGLRPDTERIARAENFMEDGTIDVRRD
jgi:hypothetical protein|tara:strand:+ start:5180 stop:5476 length:297 start_codon:yes stop_codon:yes gene_type:complete